MQCRHTADNVASETAAILAEFHINHDKISALVSYNDSNMVKCAAVLKIPHGRCFAHIL